MPTASGSGGGAGAWMDHDAATVFEAPPIQNQWYTVFHDYNVRLIWCQMSQANDETAAKQCEVRWTIDGNVYFKDPVMDDSDPYYIYKDENPSTGGALGLNSTKTPVNAASYVDKRGLDFKVEVRIIDAVGTNQVLVALCVYETAAPMI
jgi:hypothetical protein